MAGPELQQLEQLLGTIVVPTPHSLIKDLTPHMLEAVRVAQERLRHGSPNALRW